MGTYTSTRPVPEDFAPPQVRDVLARQGRGERPERTGYDGFPIYAADPLRESHLLLDAYLREGRGREWDDVKPAASASGRAILETPAEQWGRHLRAALARVLYYWTHCVAPAEKWGALTMWSYDDDGKRGPLRPLVAALLRQDPPLTEEEFAELVAARVGDDKSVDDVGNYFDVKGIVRAAERLVGRRGLTAGVRAAVSALRESRKAYVGSGNREEQARIAQLDDLLGETPPDRKAVLDGGEPWAEAAMGAIKGLPVARAKAWEALLRHGAEATGSKPTGKWLKEAKRRIDEVGAKEFSQCAGEWLALAASPRTVPLRADQVVYQWTAQLDIYGDKNEAVLRGLAWACAAAGEGALAGPLGQLAEWCYKKIPHHGPRAPKVGNACLLALIALPGQEPRAELSRLKARVKQPTAKKMIDKALAASAEAAGMTTDDLEELAVGAYGLNEVGRGRRSIGKYAAEVRIAGTTKVEVRFVDAAGKGRAAAPAELKGSHAEALKEVQQSVKDLTKMLPALRDRLERLPMMRRELPLGAWRERYVDHPVVGTLARRLIWQFDEGGKKRAGFPLDGKVIDAGGKTIKLAEAGTVVSLWHPVGAAAAEVLAWREFLQGREITQPFKQAHREVYLLTDAERTTRTYSNRFAAHVLRQPVFAALCTQRGWKYRLMGTWDGGGDTTPSVQLPRWKLRAELWLSGGDMAEDADHYSSVASYVATDQVRFYADDSTRPLNLEKVPALAFSEVMRDVDLFVGVASVGNVPNWQDAGADGRYRDYWHEYSFGGLSATADTRRAVLEKLLPRLKIQDRAKLTDRFLVVEGQLRTYRIHLGSGNILMAPNDQYLCIVPDRSSGPRDLFLPFEGDQTLTLILSKAFLLAADDEITDPTIKRQIEL
jgi:hypothetical protein